MGTRLLHVYSADEAKTLMCWDSTDGVNGTRILVDQGLDLCFSRALSRRRHSVPVMFRVNWRLAKTAISATVSAPAMNAIRSSRPD